MARAEALLASGWHHLVHEEEGKKAGVVAMYTVESKETQEALGGARGRLAGCKK